MPLVCRLNPSTLSDSDLLRNKSDDFSEGKITIHDGLVGALIPATGLFVTSPNMRQIFEPVIGTRDVYLRKDGLYGKDDFLRWPQPFNSTYRHLSCIPRQPTTPDLPYFEDAVMWKRWDPWYHVQFRGLEGVGLLDPTVVEELNRSIERLFLRLEGHAVQQILRQHSNLEPYITLQKSIIRNTLSRVSQVHSPTEFIGRCFRELQRAWLTLSAWIDWWSTFGDPSRSVFQTASPCTSPVRHVIGATCNSDYDVTILFNACIPVWFVRPVSEFSGQVILRNAECRSPHREGIEMDLPLNSRSIYAGPANENGRFEAVVQEAISLLTYPNPFPSESALTPVLLGSQEDSSPGPSRLPHRDQPRAQPYDVSRRRKFHRGGGKSSGKTSTEKGSEEQRDKFGELTGVHAPPPIPAWEGCNKTIDRQSANAKLTCIGPYDSYYYFPEPGLFFGLQGGTGTDKLTSYFCQWTHMRLAMLLRHWKRRQDPTSTRTTREPAQPIANQQWRDLLSLQWLEQTPSASPEAETRRSRHRQHLHSIIESWTPEDVGVPALVSPQAANSVGLSERRRMVWELCELNFRFELFALDSRLARPDQSHNADAITRFHFQRQNKILDCFPGYVTSLMWTDASRARSGLADPDWRVRFRYLMTFWQIMNDWHSLTPKPATWRRVQIGEVLDEDAGREWEKCLICYYCQTFFDYFHRPPVLPRTLDLTDLPI